MTERAATTEDVNEWARAQHSEVRSLNTRIDATRTELIATNETLRKENTELRERIVKLEGFRAWHDKTWDALVAKVDRIDRLVWIAAGAGAATGGGVAAVLKLIGGL